MKDRRTEVGRVILDVAPRILRDETNSLAALDTPLTHRQYRILHRVATGMTSLTAISKVASISVAAISESADALLKRELLARETDKQDRRASKLSLTAKGEQAVQAAEKALDELALIVVANLSAEQLTFLEDALGRVGDNVKRHLLEGFSN